MGERQQKGKEGLRMQPYCVSWRDLDSEALVLRSVLRPCFRLWLQHLPPATLFQPSPPLRKMSYHIRLLHYGNVPLQANVWEMTILIALANCDQSQ